MPDKKTLNKAKKAGKEEAEAPEEAGPSVEDAPLDLAEEPMPAEGMPGEAMLEGPVGEEPMMEAGGSPVDAIQAALDEGVTSADELMTRLMDAGFEVVPAAGAGPLEEGPEAPMGLPDTAGDLRAQVRGAAARALGRA